MVGATRPLPHGRGQTPPYSTILCGYDAPAYDAGFRFLTVPVPNAATITSATIQLRAWATKSGFTVTLDWYGIAEDDCAAWAGDGTNRPYVRSKTTAHTPVVDLAITGDAWSPAWDITATVQEIVNRPGWVSNNAMGLCLCYTSGTSGYYAWYSADYDAASSAKLDITYADAGRRRVVVV